MRVVRVAKLVLKVVLVLVLVAAAVVPLSLLFRQQTGTSKGTLDFAAFYTAGTIVKEGNARGLYDLSLQRKVESGISTGGPFLAYYHPPFEALLFVPLTLLGYPLAFLVWAAMNLLVLGVALAFLRHSGYRLDTDGYLTWLAIVIFLTLGVLVLGQDTLPLVLVFLLAFLALKRRRDYVAGLVLGLGLFRFEILLPFVFIFVLRRRWRFLAGFCTAAVAASAVSLGLVGGSGMVAYARALVEVGTGAGQWTTTTALNAMPSLRGALEALASGILPSPFTFPLVLVGTVALLGWAALEFQSMSNPESSAFDLEFSAATLAALLASYHIFVHELTPLIVIAFLILGHEGIRPREGLFGNRKGTALLLIFAAVYGIGGAAFHFRDFSVLFIVLLGLIVCVSQELAALRMAAPLG